MNRLSKQNCPWLGNYLGSSNKYIKRCTSLNNDPIVRYDDSEKKCE